MLIGAVARQSGVPAKTLRYYESIGLLASPQRSPSGYREFDPGVFDRLAFIRSGRTLGLSLAEIRGIIAVRDDGESPCGHVLGLLRSRSAAIAGTIRELRALHVELERLVTRAEALDPAGCDPKRVCHLLGQPAVR